LESTGLGQVRVGMTSQSETGAPVREKATTSLSVHRMKNKTLEDPDGGIMPKIRSQWQNDQRIPIEEGAHRKEKGPGRPAERGRLGTNEKKGEKKKKRSA